MVENYKQNILFNEQKQYKSMRIVCMYVCMYPYVCVYPCSPALKKAIRFIIQHD